MHLNNLANPDVAFVIVTFISNHIRIKLCTDDKMLGLFGLDLVFIKIKLFSFTLLVL